MKISENMSAGSYLLQLRIMRVVAAAFFLGAFVFRALFFELMAFAVVIFVCSLLFIQSRADSMLEVFDCGDHLKLKLDDEHILVNLSDIRRMEKHVGNEEPDWVSIQVDRDTRFGRSMRFYPVEIRKPMVSLDTWVMRFNERIYAARTGR